MKYFFLFLIGAIAGFFSGTFGVGGGFIVVPMLYAVMGFPPEVVVSISAFQMVGTSLSGAVTHAINKNVRYKIAFYLVIPSLFGSYLGASITDRLASEKTFSLCNTNLYASDIFLTGILTVLFLVIGMYSIRQGKRKTQKIEIKFGKKKHNKPLYYILAGLIAGLCPSMLGIGGGFLIVSFLMYFVGLSPVQATAISLAQIFFASSASVFFLSKFGQFHPEYAVAILLGSMPVASFFAHRSKKYSPEKVKVGFGILCLLAMLIQIAGFIRKMF